MREKLGGRERRGEIFIEERERRGDGSSQRRLGEEDWRRREKEKEKEKE